MREYKFRGWDAVGEKGWVYGDLVHNQKVTRMGLEPRTMVGGYEVFPESVGLWTGLKDMQGKEIYDGDIVSVFYEGKHIFDANIVWIERYAGFYMDEGEGSYSPIPKDNVKVVGTVFKYGKQHEEPHDKLLETNLADCGLSVWTLSVCRNNGITTLGDLTKIGKLDFYKFRNCGKKTFNEVDALLEKYNLEWKQL